MISLQRLIEVINNLFLKIGKRFTDCRASGRTRQPLRTYGVLVRNLDEGINET